LIEPVVGYLWAVCLIALFLVGMLLIYASRNIADRIEIALFNGIVRVIWAIIAVFSLVNYDLLRFLYVIVTVDLVLVVVYGYYYYAVKKQYE